MCSFLVKTILKISLWESRTGAVKAILLQFDNVIECVNDLKNKTDNSETLSNCKAVFNKMLTFKFIVPIHVWYEILLYINNISKLWQSIQVNLKVAVDTLRSFCTWLQEFRDTGFENLELQMLDCLWKKALTKLSHNLKKKE